jgi:hypothetical protein
MNKNVIYISALIILVAIIGVAAFMMSNPSAQSQVTEAGTKIAYHNNGTTWVHSAGVLENVTLKNGTTTNMYLDSWTQPNDKVILDLSNEMGYGNESLVAGTVIKGKLWLDPVDSNPTGSAAINQTLNGWSNTQEPVGNLNATFVSFPNHQVLQLPSNITESQIEVTTDTVKGVGFISNMQTLYIEYQITVNADQSVTITILQQPELCNLVAGG